MKSVNEMSIEELERFVKYAKEQTKVLNQLFGRRGDSKFQISVFNGCRNEIQIDNRLRDIRNRDGKIA